MRPRPLLLVAVALVVPLVWGLACSTSSVRGPGESSVATVQEAIGPRGDGGLTACTANDQCTGGFVCCAGFCAAPATTDPSASPKLAFTTGETLNYKCYQNRVAANVPSTPSNILPDFSYAGYRRSEQAIPSSLPCASLQAQVNGDDTDRIQAELDRCGTEGPGTADPVAVVLSSGEFRLNRPLRIRKSGVVLRGAGQGPLPDGTVLVSTRPIAHSLINVAPHAEGNLTSDKLPRYPAETGALTITDLAVPVGATRFKIATGGALQAGDQIVVVKTPNEEWFDDIGVRDNFEGWREPVVGGSCPCPQGQFCDDEVCKYACPCAQGQLCQNGACYKQPIAIRHLRKVESYDKAGLLVIDIPMVDAIYKPHGGGYVARVRVDDDFDGDGDQDLYPFVERAGVEDLRIEAQYVDNYPATCANGAGTDDDTFCGCDEDGISAGGKGCNTANDCAPGHVCQPCTAGEDCWDWEKPGKCACIRPTGAGCQTSANCSPGLVCDKASGQSTGTCETPCVTTENCEADGGEALRGRVCVRSTDPSRPPWLCKYPGGEGRCGDGTRCNAGDGSWNGIRFGRTRNSWVRRVTVRQFGMSAVTLSDWSSFNTVEEVAHLDPDSPIEPGTVCDYNDEEQCEACRGRPRPAGCECRNNGNPQSGHRYSFSVGEGIGNLFQRCFARRSRHTFVTGARVTGPHVWLDSMGLYQRANIGPHQRWATGLLFDNIQAKDPNVLALCTWGEGGLGLEAQNSDDGASGHGWTGAQVMIWNSEAPTVSEAPAGAMNWVVGGIAHKVDRGEGEPFGIWQLTQTSVKPRSLFMEQLKARVGQAQMQAVTSKPQQTHRIWEDLERWQGEGSLISKSADPDCRFGMPDDQSPACCPTSCVGVGCGSTSSLPQHCRSGSINADAGSCMDGPGPCVRPNPTCDGGVADGGFCCPSSCTQCGSSTSLPPNCRTTDAGSCADRPAPCKLADPDCDYGVVGEEIVDAGGVPTYGRKVCCQPGCAQCGGSGCGTCCTGTILADGGPSCNSRMATCIMPN
jgi:hypothetical protein